MGTTMHSLYGQHVTLPQYSHILALSTGAEQVNELDVVVERRVRGGMFPVLCHQLDQLVEALSVVVQQHHFLPCLQQLKNSGFN